MRKLVTIWALLGVLGSVLACNRSAPAPAQEDNPTATATAARAESQAAPAAPTSPGGSATQPEGEAPLAFDSPPPVGTRARCPVMGNTFVVTAESQRSEHGGKHYVFCCPSCKPRFDANPSQFLAAAQGAQ